MSKRRARNLRQPANDLNAVANVKFAICVSSKADDKSGEDYLYAKEQFDLVDLPEAARSHLLAAIAPYLPASFGWRDRPLTPLQN